MQSLPKHGSCFVCGSPDSPGMGVTWYADDDRTVFAEVTLNDAQQGPPGFAHGGASAALLDEAMGAAVWLAGYRVASVNLSISYHKPVLLGTPFTVIARVHESNGRKVMATGEIRLEDGTVAVNGEGVFVEAPQLFIGLKAAASQKSGEEPKESRNGESDYAA